MNVKDFEIDVENGFAWIIVEGKDQSRDFTVQCCLQAVDGEDGAYAAQIKMSDCGHDWGMSGDANKEAFEFWGENRCMTTLFRYAKQAGVEVEE